MKPPPVPAHVQEGDPLAAWLVEAQHATHEMRGLLASARADATGKLYEQMMAEIPLAIKVGVARFLRLERLRLVMLAVLAVMLVNGLMWWFWLQRPEGVCLRVEQSGVERRPVPHLFGERKT